MVLQKGAIKKKVLGKSLEIKASFLPSVICDNYKLSVGLM